MMKQAGSLNSENTHPLILGSVFSMNEFEAKQMVNGRDTA